MKKIIGVDPLKNSKKILFQKSKCTHVSSINLKGKVSDSKNIVTAVIYFCNYPYGTPCILCIYCHFLLTWRPLTDGDDELVGKGLDELFIDGALYTRTILFSSSIGSTELSIKSEGKRLSNWVLADWTVRSSWIISSGELRYINMWI